MDLTTTPMAWKTFPAPDLERVIVAGWQPHFGRVDGYWWFHEDHTDEGGMPMKHPGATLWVRLSEVLPPLPDRPEGV